jgi:hypothetical protein
MNQEAKPQLLNGVIVCERCLPSQHCGDFEYTGGYRYQFKGTSTELLNVVQNSVLQCPLNQGAEIEIGEPEELPSKGEVYVSERKPSYPTKRGTGEIIP